MWERQAFPTWERYACPLLGTRYWTSGRRAAHWKAMLMWQWYNFVECSVPPARQVLRINLDETAVCLHPDTGKGNVFITTRPVYRVQRWKTRTYFTHVAIVCDKMELQPHMPQLIIGNERTLLVRELPALRRNAPSNVVLVRQKSAWNNAALMANIVGRIAAAVRPYLDAYQPVLIMDVVSLHTRRVVLEACRRHAICPVFVPACTTPILQPLDVHVFHLYKAALRRRYHDLLCGNTCAELRVPEFLTCIYHALDAVIEGRDWSSAFDACGLGHGQTHVASHVLRDLDLVHVRVAADRPTLPELTRCFPRRAQVQLPLLLPPRPGVACAGAVERRAEPIAARTRGRMRIAAMS
jgi:hypothetical protein